MLMALREDSKDVVTTSNIDKLLNIDTSALESTSLLDSATHIQCIMDYDKYISRNRFHSINSSSSNSISCGIRWDPPNPDSSNSAFESVMVITRILRWPLLELHLDQTSNRTLKEIIRYRLGDLERTVTRVKFSDIPLNIRRSVREKDFSSFFSYIFPGLDSSDLDVYDVATKLSRIWFYKPSLAQVALQHEFVHELLCAFPNRFINDTRGKCIENGYESFVP